jgi:D-arabinose 1-dehydrogenase-like Zn-dependent alcohol dehydrogenase
VDVRDGDLGLGAPAHQRPGVMRPSTPRPGGRRWRRLAALARAGRLVIIGSRPRDVFGEDTSFTVHPGRMLSEMLEIHGSRYVTLAEIQQTLELLRQKRIRAIVSRTFPLEGAEEAHELLRKNALVGRAALLLGR